jgi:hypothetical protein
MIAPSQAQLQREDSMGCRCVFRHRLCNGHGIFQVQKGLRLGRANRFFFHQTIHFLTQTLHHARLGANVVVSARRENALNALVHELQSSNATGEASCNSTNIRRLGALLREKEGEGCSQTEHDLRAQSKINDEGPSVSCLGERGRANKRWGTRITNVVLLLKSITLLCHSGWWS